MDFSEDNGEMEFVERFLIKELLAIVKQANIIILNVYQKVTYDIDYKKDQSPVTEADTLASNYICKALGELDTSIPIICEETTLEPYNIRKTYKQFWLVDPLDGTKEFINRNGEFTVNIALMKRNKKGEYEPIIGFVSVPVQSTIYCAEKGFGAWKYNVITEESTRLSCIPFSSGELTVVCSRSHPTAETEEFIANLGSNIKTIATGSSLKFMKLCENEAHIYPRFCPCMEWDIAASHAILKEAGGTLLSPNGESLLYNKNNLLVESFIAYGNIPNY